MKYNRLLLVNMNFRVLRKLIERGIYYIENKKQKKNKVCGMGPR